MESGLNEVAGEPLATDDDSFRDVFSGYGEGFRPSPETSRAVPLPQTNESAPMWDEYEKQRAGSEIARNGDENFRVWLTRVPRGEEDQRWYYYQFLGDAYVHGMMNGGAIEVQSL